MQWIEGVRVQLIQGNVLSDGQGNDTDVIHDATVAIDGGFLHIIVPGASAVQVVAGHAVWRLVYRPAMVEREVVVERQYVADPGYPQP